jgi:hypothetical protein
MTEMGHVAFGHGEADANGCRPGDLGVSWCEGEGGLLVAFVEKLPLLLMLRQPQILPTRVCRMLRLE